ncbi:HlyD family secretion protein [Pedobacter gandavensis]|uniref:HlyD family secretion protein n=1 Tax=Pedobacter gandavensis TaxID=2679963 RepID=UPI00292D08FD|nr:HlyD family efflux transporter periplasmic adaptor subunit [Pedobacter gandavensis]
MEKLSKIYELNDEDEPIREILGKVPSWIIRWGNSLILLFFISLLAISIIIKYPESIYSKAKLVSVNAPKPIIAKLTGKLTQINFKEDAMIKKGDIIGFVESVANRNQVLDMFQQIKQLRKALDSDNPLNFEGTLSEISHNELGELQQSFQTFSQAYLAYKNYIPGAFYDIKKKMLLADMGNLNSSEVNLQKEKFLLQQDLALSKTNFDVNESLRQKRIISELEYRTEKSKMINKLISVPQIDASILSTKSLKSEKQKEILELENTITTQKFHFSEALSTFNSQIEDWIKKYALVAPIEGVVSYKNFIQVNQQVQMGQVICYINPPSSQYYAEMYIPQSNFGKVKLGQKVLLKFPSYPYQEYGVVEGRVNFISRIGVDSGYLSKVTFTNNLVTTYNKKILYKDGMIANTEIITKDMRLIERFYYNIIKFVKR